MEIISWVQLNHHSVLDLNLVTEVVNQVQSNAILIAYLLTFIRSYKYCVTFVLIDLLGNNAFFGVYEKLLVSDTHIFGGCLYNYLFYMTYAILYGIAFSFILRGTNSKAQRSACGIIILLCSMMALSEMTTGEFRNYANEYYASSILCCHVLLILSLYRPKTIISAIGAKLRSILRFVDNLLFFNLVRYFKNTKMCKMWATT